MQVSISKPNTEKLQQVLVAKKDSDFSYAEVGSSKKEQTAGYDNDHQAIYLGNGEDIWQRAKVTLTHWQQFPFSWTQIYPTTAPIRKEQRVVVLFRLFGLWWINSASIVYTFDEPNRFGFAYGTLPGHVEKGEERFWLERDSTGAIYYHIRAFSKPAYWVVWLVYPLARMFQRRFVKQSQLQMKSIVSNKNSFIETG